MKIHFLFKGLTACIFITMAACSTVMVMKKRLPNEWNITKYEEKALDGSAYSAVNIGSIKFETNGTGTKSINFNLADRMIEDYQPFEWRVLADTVIISGTSYFSRAWTVMENSPSNQIWKSTDKMGGVQTLLLSKNKMDARISLKNK